MATFYIDFVPRAWKSLSDHLEVERVMLISDNFTPRCKSVAFTKAPPIRVHFEKSQNVPKRGPLWKAQDQVLVELPVLT